MTPEDPQSSAEMPLLAHLTELRQRLVRSFYGVVIGFALVYGFAEKIFQWLMRPLCQAVVTESSGLTECPIVYTGIAEPFMVYLKVGILGGIFVSAPWIFLQIWGFISPGLHYTEKKLVTPFVAIASVMFVGGALLGYFFIFPLAFEFFIKVATPDIRPMLSMTDYFSFASGLLFAFGLLFEIPVFVVLLNFIGLLKAATLWRTWRQVTAGIFILAAVLTPADPYTMLLLGTPLATLYIVALVFCSIQEKLRGKRLEASAS